MLLWHSYIFLIYMYFKKSQSGNRAPMVSHTICTHKHVHYTISNCWKITSNTKQSLTYRQISFVDTRLYGLSNVKIFVSSNFEYFFLTCFYRGKVSKKRFSQTKKNNIFAMETKFIFSRNDRITISISFDTHLLCTYS